LKPTASDLAADISLEALSADPYPLYAALREKAPVVFAPRLGFWIVTRYDDVREMLLDAERFVVGADASLLFQTFGEHMLSSDGSRQRRYRDGQIQGAFMAKPVAARFGRAIDRRVAGLLDEILDRGSGDLRPIFAARLPIQVMLDVFGLPDADETKFRAWYDSFEAALANHAGDEGVAKRAAANVAAFHAYFQTRIELARRTPGRSLLDDFLERPAQERLTDAELRRNALIVFFGGISTVEALILNALWALFRHPPAMMAVRADPACLPAALDETMRWLAPVQTATRHTLAEVDFKGVTMPAQATVACALASANRDPGVFVNPDLFDIGRANARRHLGFAIGPHHCLGQHLAKAEAVAALTALLRRAPKLRLLRDVEPEGHEFRQPRSLHLGWD
jgi:cytochrome P450